MEKLLLLEAVNLEPESRRMKIGSRNILANLLVFKVGQKKSVMEKCLIPLIGGPSPKD